MALIRCIPRLLLAPCSVDYGHNPRGAKVESPRVSRIGALLQGLGCAPGTSRFLPNFGSGQESSSAPGRRGRRSQSTRSRMPVMRGLLAPQNTFLDTIATRFDGTLEKKLDKERETLSFFSSLASVCCEQMR
ncbi:hypothetical protein NQZ68_032115 [Dissostichus eleginoides]|nr:hypothetical protein NQZ68_032115 [Dissostichus eleginoides]